MKFNKLIQQIKDDPYKPKPKEATTKRPKKSKTIALADVRVDGLEEDSEERREREEAELREKADQEEEEDFAAEMKQIDVEGGDAEIRS